MSEKVVTAGMPHGNKMSVSAFLTCGQRNRHLIVRLIARELSARWRGTLLGALWSFVTPLLIFAVYSFVFTEIFTPRWSSQHSGAQSYPLLLFAGILTYNIFSETTNRAPTLILENPAYVKRVVFPLEILPWVSLGAAMTNALFGYLILFIAYFFVLGVPPPTALLLPITLLPLCLLCLGLGWLLSSLGVFVRDIRHLVGALTMLLMFLSPVLFPLEGAPPRFRTILMFNPLTPILKSLRAVLFWNELPDWRLLGLAFIEGLAVSWIGWVWFQRTRKAFADVL